MTLVNGKITAPDGSAPTGATVTVQLVDLTGQRTIGFADGSEIVHSATAPVGIDGSWSMELVPTADIESPRGDTLYRVVEQTSSGPAPIYHISVPSTGPAWAGDIRIGLPGDLTVVSGGGGGDPGTPSGTVVSETTFGQAASAGSAGAYARGDHTHGTPALPTPGAIGAATVAHDHSGVYDPSGTASGAVSAHTAASDPHGDRAYADTVAAGVSPAFPIFEGYGLRAASGDPIGWLKSSGIANGTIFFARCWVPAGVTITNLWAAVAAAGTHDGSSGPNRIGLYSAAGSLIGATVDNPALWTAAGWRGGPLGGGPIAAQASGRFVYIGILAQGMSGGSWPYPTNADDSHVPWADFAVSGTARRAMYLSGQSALPASIDPASTGTATTFIPLVGAS